MLHLIEVEGKPVVIAVDCRTRFSFTLTGFKQGNKNDFMNYFKYLLRVHVHSVMIVINANSPAVDSSLDTTFISIIAASAFSSHFQAEQCLSQH
ncbi:MAG: hypothetical protein HRU05_14240 [Oceanospirillaceae bacterium]|nr:hypothetical protein [Oceanospirillaceae bacterium]